VVMGTAKAGGKSLATANFFQGKGQRGKKGKCIHLMNRSRLSRSVRRKGYSSSDHP